MERLFARDQTEEKCLANMGLFKSDDLRNILISRKHFESKIKRKEKSAFFSYIDHELNLLNKIKSYSKDQDQIEKIISQRITKLHKLGLSYFKDDLKLWLSHIKFCTQAGYVHLVSEAFTLMLQVHTQKRLWHLAAQWELDECNNVDKALNYLYRGLQFNPTARSLYIHIFKLELSSANSSQTNSRIQNLIEKQDESENKATKLFEKATKELSNDMDLYFDLLKIALEYNFTVKLQTKLSQFLTETFSSNETMWHLMAQRELEGHHLAQPNCTYEYIPESRLEDRIKNCIEKYQSVVEVIPTETMWEKYLNTLVDLYEGIDTNSFIKQTFMSACSVAHTMCVMSEKHYMVWLECLNDATELPKILESATKAKPEYLQLWVARLRHHMTKKEEDRIEPIFEDAINALGDNSIQIWRMKLQYYQLHNSMEKIESIYCKGLTFSTYVSSCLQPQYLEWLALFKSMEVVRKVYQQLAGKAPVCIELHKKMAELEAMCANPSEEIFNSIRNVMDHNSNEKNLWKDYVNEEIHYGATWKREIYKKNLSTS